MDRPLPKLLLALITALAAFVSACSDNAGFEGSGSADSSYEDKRDSAVTIRAEPEPNSTLTESPRSVRLFFEFAPNVENSEIRLTGPAGPIPLMGLHTMGMNDLMIMVDHPPLQDGRYSVSWSAIGFDGDSRSRGDYSFVIATR